MTITRSSYLDIAASRSPHLLLGEAAYFLQLSWNQVDRLWRTGKLPRPVLADGTDYRPGGQRLIVAADLMALLPDPAREQLLLWQRGALEVPRLASKTARPAPLGEGIRTDQLDRSADR